MIFDSTCQMGKWSKLDFKCCTISNSIILLLIPIFRVSFSGCPGQNILPGMLGWHAIPFWNPHGMPRKHVKWDVPLREPLASNTQKSVCLSHKKLSPFLVLAIYMVDSGRPRASRFESEIRVPESKLEIRIRIWNWIENESRKSGAKWSFFTWNCPWKMNWRKKYPFEIRKMFGFT